MSITPPSSGGRGKKSDAVVVVEFTKRFSINANLGRPFLVGDSVEVIITQTEMDSMRRQGQGASEYLILLFVFPSVS